MAIYRNVKEIRRLRHLFISIIALCLLSVSQVIASDANDDDFRVTADSKRLSPNTYSMMDADTHSPKMLLVEGEQAYRRGDIDVALHKIKQSLWLDNDDMDAHLLYAEVMTEQLNNQTEKDPTLFNKAVEEWLNVMRNRYGDEKRMRWRGINPFGDLYNDEDRSIPAKTALVKLTGSSPHSLETDAHYLKRVLMPSTITVTAKVVTKKGKKMALPIAEQEQESKNNNQ